MSPGPALDLRFKLHPWHGVSIGAQAPQRVTVRRSQTDYRERFSRMLGTLGGRS